MNINTIEGDLIEVSLRQLGACTVKTIKSNMYFVDFDLGDNMFVSYVFNITSGDKYFLQRTKPYAIVHGKFADEREIVEFITEDLAQFRNAANSSNFKFFIAQADRINHLNELIENLFLNHNVDRQLLEKLSGRIDDIVEEINDIKSTAAKL